jgi:hypothetical protein
VRVGHTRTDRPCEYSIGVAALVVVKPDTLIRRHSKKNKIGLGYGPVVRTPEMKYSVSPKQKLGTPLCCS